MNRLLAVAGFLFCIASANAAQAPAVVNGTCAGPIFRAAKVTRPARLINFGKLRLSTEAAQQNVRGTVVINAVLCRDGSVREIKVFRGLPLVTESAINQLLNARFIPAELNFHSVSQALQFQFTIDDSGVSTVIKTEFDAAPQRLVEEIDFLGMRRTPREKVFARIKTRPGDPYNPDQVNADLQSVLRGGDFDKMGTRVMMEDAPRGGVRVIFDLVELPLIREVKFLNVSLEDQVAIGEGLRKYLDLRPGAVLDPPGLLVANRIIEGFFKSKGAGNVKIENLIERPSETEAIVIFKITPVKVGP
ncbi:MAG TPA: POTRA domain-containing protein [Pyrinomonadaceae bacterium]|jgi:hypothetical protein|nr:POTRA domain-containing protein [Pyrinomonadaceae bacterium]